MQRHLVSFLIALLAIGLFSCEDNEFDNSGPSTLDVRIEALNTRHAIPFNASKVKSALADSIYVEWDSVHLVVSQVKFEAKLNSQVTQRDSIEIEYKWTGPQLADLLNPDLSFGNFVLQPGYYDEIEIKVKGKKEDAEDIPVFFMQGTFNGSTATLPVEVRVNNDIEFKTERDSVEITETNTEIISHIQLRLDELMEKITPEDLDNSRLTDGVIVISSKSNRDIYYTIMKNMVKKHRCDYKHKHKWKKYHDDDDDDDD